MLTKLQLLRWILHGVSHLLGFCHHAKREVRWSPTVFQKLRQAKNVKFVGDIAMRPMRTSLHILAPHDICKYATTVTSAHNILVPTNAFSTVSRKILHTTTAPHGSKHSWPQKKEVWPNLWKKKKNATDTTQRVNCGINPDCLKALVVSEGSFPPVHVVYSDNFTINRFVEIHFVEFLCHDLYTFDRRLRAMEKKTWIAAKCRYHNIEFPGSIQVGQHSRVSEVRPQPCTQEANGKASWMHSLGCRHLW